MPFAPESCPRADCASRTGAPFIFHRRGSFRRACDRRVVPRFSCLACGKSFSEQTFRLDFRLKRPELLPAFFVDRVSKVTHRQSARNHRCSRTTEERHFRRLARHCKAFHEAKLAAFVARGGELLDFVFDELETYEHHRIQKPVTAGMVVEGQGFVVDAQVGSMPARNRRTKEKAGPPASRVPVRRSESREVVQRLFERVRELSGTTSKFSLRTDLKTSYAALKDQILGERCIHSRTSSKRRRDFTNPLWPINHTFARVRDGISRLVRETWAAAKRREWLQGHLMIWTCYRNYVRGRKNCEPRSTPATALGVADRQFSPGDLLQWRVLPGW